MKLFGRTVFVETDNIEKSLRKFKKKVAQSGILDDYKDHEFYTKPTIKKMIKKNQAKLRWRRYLNDHALPRKNF